MAVKLPIGSNFAAEQIRRMRGMPGYPSKMSAQEIEMIEALGDNARDEQHAKQIITQLIRGWRSPNLPLDEQAKEARFCPRVVDVVDAAHADDEPAVAPTQPAEYAGPRAGYVCERCKDMGFEYIGTPLGFTGTVRVCRCRRGTA